MTAGEATPIWWEAYDEEMETHEQKKPRKNLLRTLMVLLLLALLAPVLIFAIYVEDWGRDLTTNIASTSVDGSDQSLRPLEVDASSTQVKEALESLCESSTSWESASEPVPVPEDATAFANLDKQVDTIHLLHVSGIFKYRDDIWIALEEKPAGGLRLHAESRSRIGKGDLGQNPRNIRELFSYLQSSIN